MSDIDKVLLGGAGLLTTSVAGISVYERNITNKIHNRIDTLEDKFKICKIPFQKIEKKNFVSIRTFTESNLDKRILNLENALNSYNNSHFGSKLDDPSAIMLGSLFVGSTAISGGINMFNIKRKMNKFIKRLDSSEKQLKIVCNNK